MSIPQQLAFPPTALRNVAAGRVVGNPVGSSGTRGKALASAELKAIVEASGISYLPLSGGTLTGALSLGSNALTAGAITASGNLILRNGTTPMSASVEYSYTSDTARSYLSLAANSSNASYDVCSRVGSASGTNYPIRLGHLAADGTTFVGMSVATSGDVKASTSLTIGGTDGFGFNRNINDVVAILNGAEQWRYSSSGGTWIRMATAGHFGIGDEVKWRRGATGPTFDACAMGGLRVRNLANSADAALTCGAITASGQITHTPPSSVTLATNGQFSVEMTSNTAGNLVYRGADGTTRRFAFTVS